MSHGWLCMAASFVCGCSDEPTHELDGLSSGGTTDDTGTEVTDDTGSTDSGPTESTPPDTGDSAVDGDGDGYSPPDDCDDSYPTVHPGAIDKCDDDIDQDCVDGPADCSVPDITLDAADTRIRPSVDPDSIGFVVVSLGDLDGDGNGDLGTLWMSDLAPYGWGHKSPNKEAWVFSGPIDAGDQGADGEAVAIVRQTDSDDDQLYAMASAGDVDGDGYDDLVLGTWQDWGGVYVLLGPVVGDDLTVADDAVASWTTEDLNEGAGHSVDGGFDFDGDGHDDFVVGSTWALDSDGAAYWISGDDLEFDHFSDADAMLDGLSSDSCRGWNVTALGDVDGDGLEDFATAAYTGPVFVYTGGDLSGELASDDAAHAGFDRISDDDQWGKWIADGGDFNDDGYSDLLISATDSSAGTVHLMAGPMDTSGDADALALATFEGAASGDELGEGMDGSMDVNGDGNTDVLLGSPGVRLKYSDHLEGAAYLFYGPMTGAIATYMARCTMRGTDYNDNAGWSVAMIGDQYGDGLPDVLIGEPFTGDTAFGDYWTGGMLHVVSSEHL
jgi:hypothetical protein